MLLLLFNHHQHTTTNSLYIQLLRRLKQFGWWAVKHGESMEPPHRKAQLGIEPGTLCCEATFVMLSGNIADMDLSGNIRPVGFRI